MLWVRYTVFALLVVFVALSTAANVLPCYRYTSSTAGGTLDPSMDLYVHSSTFYLWYHEVQFAANAPDNVVALPALGDDMKLPGKSKLTLRVVAGNMVDVERSTSDQFSHAQATCHLMGGELQGASAVAVLSSAVGGVALFVVAWGRGPVDQCLVPGWVVFTLTTLAAILELVAVALTAHMRANAVCYGYTLSREGYAFGSGFILLCVAFAGFVVTTVLQAVCPMCCCCCGDVGALEDEEDYDFDAGRGRDGDAGHTEMPSVSARSADGANPSGAFSSSVRKR